MDVLSSFAGPGSSRECPIINHPARGLEAMTWTSELFLIPGTIRAKLTWQQND